MLALAVSPEVELSELSSIYETRGLTSEVAIWEYCNFLWKFYNAYAFKLTEF
jgi:hypothetical protein